MSHAVALMLILAALVAVCGCAPDRPANLPASCFGACPAPWDPNPHGPDDTGECYCQAPYVDDYADPTQWR